jgi:hypothetical protein
MCLIIPLFCLRLMPFNSIVSSVLTPHSPTIHLRPLPSLLLCVFLASLPTDSQPQFARDVLPIYYKHNNYASFVRQLNMYGFNRSTELQKRKVEPGVQMVEHFTHQYFQRGQEQLLEYIHRKTSKQGGKPAKSSRRIGKVKDSGSSCVSGSSSAIDIFDNILDDSQPDEQVQLKQDVEQLKGSMIQLQASQVSMVGSLQVLHDKSEAAAAAAAAATAAVAAAAAKRSRRRTSGGGRKYKSASNAEPNTGTSTEAGKRAGKRASSTGASADSVDSADSNDPSETTNSSGRSSRATSDAAASSQLSASDSGNGSGSGNMLQRAGGGGGQTLQRAGGGGGSSVAKALALANAVGLVFETMMGSVEDGVQVGDSRSSTVLEFLTDHFWNTDPCGPEATAILHTVGGRRLRRAFVLHHGSSIYPCI